MEARGDSGYVLLMQNRAEEEALLGKTGDELVTFQSIIVAFRKLGPCSLGDVLVIEKINHLVCATIQSSILLRTLNEEWRQHN